MALEAKSEELTKERNKCADLLKMNMVLTKQLSESKLDSMLSATKHKKRNSEMTEMLECKMTIT